MTLNRATIVKVNLQAVTIKVQAHERSIAEPILPRVGHCSGLQTVRLRDRAQDAADYEIYDDMSDPTSVQVRLYVGVRP